MKDNFENELNIGDVIYFASSRGVGNNCKLAKGVVIGFTDTKVKVSPTNGYRDWDTENKVIMLTPSKIGKVNVNV